MSSETLSAPLPAIPAPLSSARDEYAQAAANLARVLRQPAEVIPAKNPCRPAETTEAIAERLLERARDRYRMALQSAAESREPAWKPGERSYCPHVLEHVGQGVYQCGNCGRVGDWVDGLIVWREVF